MIEHFKPAGHKAQELSDIVLPEETFKPIQRVVKRPRFLERLFGRKEQTVGYLYRDIEYKKGKVGDIVLSAMVLANGKKELHYHSLGWQRYENDHNKNPYRWFVPSGPLTTELIYRTQQDIGPIGKNANESWNSAIKELPQTSTIITCEDGIAQVAHNWNEPAITTNTPEEEHTVVTGDNGPNTQQFLQTVLGKRHAHTHRIFGQYGTPVRLWTKNKGTIALEFCRSNGGTGFLIDAYISRNYPMSARGVSLLENFPSPQYKVRDD